MMERVESNLLLRASHFTPFFLVKNNPLLEIYFKYNDLLGVYCPVGFSGLVVHAGHSGSEGLVKLIEFKPEMDAYLEIMGINYINKSIV